MPLATKRLLPTTRRALSIACALVLLPVAGVLLAQAVLPKGVAADDPAVLDAELKPKAAQSLLLDVTHSNAGFFAVGERGHVLQSEDGKQWKQVSVPSRAALTGIATQEGQLWAVGHDGVILHSPDNGGTWYRRRVQPFDAQDQSITNGAPMLDVYFSDAKNGIAVGAYSLYLSTADGGVTWTERRLFGSSAPTVVEDLEVDESGNFNAEDLVLDEESDPHYNAIVRTGSGSWVIAGERGTMLRSTDGGANWSKVAIPYRGSMFGLIAWSDDRVMAFGLRGNVFESTDGGASWRKVDTGTNASLMGGYAGEGGAAVLVGANGVMLSRPNADAAFTASSIQNAAGETPVLSGVASVDGKQWLLIGDKGAELHSAQ